MCFSVSTVQVLSDQVDDEEVSTTDGEMCSDFSDEEVWPKVDGQQSARANRTTSMKRVRHKKAWKVVGFNDEIQYLGSGSGWIKVSAIMDSGAAESVAPPSVCQHLQCRNQQGPSVDKNITQPTALDGLTKVSDASKQ